MPTMAKRPWDATADALLRKLWVSAFGLDEMAAILKRTPKAVHHRASDLKLPAGAPPGHEILTRAAARVGYAPQQLREILAWARVPIHPVRAMPLRRSQATGKRHVVTNYFVARDEVDQAVADWVATENIVDAARRHGMNGATLRRWLLTACDQFGFKRREVGFRRTVTDHRRRQWRISPSVVDRVVAHMRPFMHKKRVMVPPLAAGGAS